MNNDDQAATEPILLKHGFWQAYVLNNHVPNFDGDQMKKDKTVDTKLYEG